MLKSTPKKRIKIDATQKVDAVNEEKREKNEVMVRRETR